jgi:pilus assembly protein Flp/PilA
MFDKMFITIQILRGSLAERFDREEGATAVEYGLLVSLIAVAIILAVTTLGGNLSAMFDGVAGEINAP